ncbi:MAG: hypothetical protein ACE5PT_09470 [Gemmatimonadales bacterium]
MGYRTFTDREGNRWEVRDRSASEWEFYPASGNPLAALRVKPPVYESDPFELSDEELQRLLDEEGGPRSRRPKSPFAD